MKFRVIYNKIRVAATSSCQAVYQGICWAAPYVKRGAITLADYIQRGIQHTKAALSYLVPYALAAGKFILEAFRDRPAPVNNWGFIYNRELYVTYAEVLLKTLRICPNPVTARAVTELEDLFNIPPVIAPITGEIAAFVYSVPFFDQRETSASLERKFETEANRILRRYGFSDIVLKILVTHELHNLKFLVVPSDYCQMQGISKDAAKQLMLRCYFDLNS